MWVGEWNAAAAEGGGRGKRTLRSVPQKVEWKQTCLVVMYIVPCTMFSIMPPALIEQLKPVWAE
jgi:hypothetical protein